MATFVILLDETDYVFRRDRGLQSSKKLYCGTLVNIKAGSRKINLK